ncbi:MAG: hypothetical protein KC713_09990 [Candidatus Omnitrophica bacterium]|nr:hypothetical protein [Candidatus Omnitrophota bacterium]
MMPVSPEHLLYTRIGSKEASRMQFSKEITQKVIRFLIERSHRRVFAWNPIKHIDGVKQRIVDAQRYKEEERQWSVWHRVQSDVEYYRI